MTTNQCNAMQEGRSSPRCPVCAGAPAGVPQNIDGRCYHECRACRATFLDPAQLPRADEEYAHYLLHENDPDDERYRRFLSKLAEPLLERLAPGLEGLDYGCGPGPALARMMSEAGHHMSVYDPFFAPDETALDRRYDFITCTETAEHFHRPGEELAKLSAMLRPGGWLGLMTAFRTDEVCFRSWRYRRDPTHVVFYREETFRLIASRLGLACTMPMRDVVLMRKPPSGELIQPVGC
jgi:2-polyprenyl-3-methyl-5-hydroxy-6-metoxy-1,4-benzoquinol methylase